MHPLVPLFDGRAKIDQKNQNMFKLPCVEETIKEWPSRFWKREIYL